MRLFETNHDENGTGSINQMLLRLQTDAERQKLAEKISNFGLRLVLTAHPTQFYPGKVLGIINDLSAAIQDHDLSEIRLPAHAIGKNNLSQPAKTNSAG